MPQHDFVVIGGSAGALQPLTTILSSLPPELRASVLIVMHTRASTDGVLPDILQRSSALPVTFATHRTPWEHGRVYVASPDFHLIVTDGALRVVHGPRENGFRPAIDPLFRTAARELGPRVIGVILSGALSDGTYGLSLIKQHGGVAIVQDPGEADVDSMPRSVMDAVDVDYVLPAADIAATVTRLSQNHHHRATAGNGERSMARQTAEDELEPQLPSEQSPVPEMERRFGPPSALTCPECGGALWEIQEGRLDRYQCHTGHQYAPETLEAEQRDAVDGALWSAVRVLEEHAALKGRMAKRAADNGLQAVSSGFAEGAREAHTQARRIRSLLFEPDSALGRETPARKQHASSARRRVTAAKRRRLQKKPGTKRRD